MGEMSNIYHSLLLLEGSIHDLGSHCCGDSIGYLGIGVFSNGNIGRLLPLN